ncbi:MAG: hypothetical protein ACLP41_04205 [Acidimicrobiales bacterium]
METGDQAEVRLLDKAEAELEDVERALKGLDEGTYGACEVCRRPIGEDGLSASPLTRRCTEHSKALAPGASAGI